MDFKKFEHTIIKMAQEVKEVQGMHLPQLIESAALEFVDDNFRNQGWEGQAWEPSTGTILVKAGVLRRGFESIVTPYQVKIINDVPYAHPHNTGFEGDVNIPEHERGQFKKVGSGKFTKKGKERLVTKKTGSGKVKAHTKHMKLDKRQFSPTETSPSPTLNKTVITIINSEMLKILKP